MSKFPRALKKGRPINKKFREEFKRLMNEESYQEWLGSRRKKPKNPIDAHMAYVQRYLQDWLRKRHIRIRICVTDRHFERDLEGRVAVRVEGFMGRTIVSLKLPLSYK